MDSGMSRVGAIPFGEHVQTHDGTAGGSWLELLWFGSLLVAMNPDCEEQQKALGSVAKAATAARKFLPADALGVDDDNVDDKTFVATMAGTLSPMMDKLKIRPEVQRVVLATLRGEVVGDKETVQ